MADFAPKIITLAFALLLLSLIFFGADNADRRVHRANRPSYPTTTTTISSVWILTSCYCGPNK